MGVWRAGYFLRLNLRLSTSDAALRRLVLCLRRVVLSAVAGRVAVEGGEWRREGDISADSIVVATFSPIKQGYGQVGKVSH